MAKQIIVVMGVQRSGTTALFQSLASDKTVTAHDESIASVVYDKYRLRPLEQIAHVLKSAPGAVLLKPLSETFYRTLQSIAEEYAAYSLHVVWIYRDPVNVLFSMHRQGWLSMAEIDSAAHLDRWVQRNRLALQFQQTHPGQITILRYEDFLADPDVFRSLAKSLDLKSRPSFRQDSSSGRINIPTAAQQKIDAFTHETLAALHRARTLRPRLSCRIKNAVAQSLTVDRTKTKRQKAQTASRARSSLVSPEISLSETGLIPSAIEGLEFWFNSSANTPDAADAPSAWHDSGPRRLTAPQIANGPFLIPCINGREAVAFPTETVAERRSGSAGILTFGRGRDWAFLFDGGPFSIVAFYKPDVPNYPPYNQRRAVLLRIGSSVRDAPAFVLGWDGEVEASKATIMSDDDSVGSHSAANDFGATTLPGSHRHQEWRIVQVQYRVEREGVLSIAANGLSGAPRGTGNHPRDVADECELRLGGNGKDCESLFYGAVAEIAIFSRAIDATEQAEITRYLTCKYDL